MGNGLYRIILLVIVGAEILSLPMHCTEDIDVVVAKISIALL